ncbi:GPH family glycoside/pentoside/hexuronide:cation symporter [Marinimicrobium koreense]|jgi:GPH family glycoside/pentoside/hexuronide:cation symporter|uniref:GPH family glycoside/pentoside/hexuronide:cation symporter n=2 Tax=Marinimicrobium TaxID=359337 RepID=A0A3N1NSK5_9GAMM|nr:MFS transporter [Marinimicrobium koreense]ROQ18401.1 GPH family glycoside/pentoside/hexuronide:cation symporter [Marinimicrobium koreense]
MKTQKLTVLEKVGFGSGDTAVNLVISSMFLIVAYFYTDIFGLKPSHMGILFLVARLVDAFTDPLMGMITDKVDTRWGRYRPYFLFLSVPFGLSIFLMFTTPDWSYNAKLVWAYATYILVTVMFTSVTIPYISLIGVLTADPKERLSANGYRLFLAKVAAFLVTIIVPIMAEAWGDGDLAVGYQASMGLMGILGTLLFLFCFFTTTERVKHEVQDKTFGEQLKILLKNDQWLVLCAVCFTGTLGYVIRSSVAAYYAKYYLGADAKMLSAFMTTGVTGALLAMIASTWITKRYCKIQLFRWTQLAVGVLSVIMFFAVQPGDIWLAFILYFLISFVVDLHAPVFWSAIAESVDYGQAKTGKRVSGLAFGGISFFQKAGMGAAGFIVGLLLTYFNYEANVEQSAFTLTGIALMLSVIPGLFHAIMGGLMFKYKITDKFYEEMKRDSLADSALAEADPNIS